MTASANKLQAQLEADKANQANLDNFAKAKAASLVKMSELGERMAEGSGAITDGAFEFGNAVLGGLAKEENAFDWYQALALGFNKRAAEFHQDAMPTDAAGLKQSVSIFRTYGRSVVVAVVAKVPGFYGRVCALRDTLTKEARAGSAYNTMAVANRRITDAIEGGLTISALVAKLTDVDAGDALILEWITKALKPAKGLPEVLRALAKSMDSKANSTGFSDLEAIAKVALKVASAIEGKLQVADAMQRQAALEAAEIIASAMAAE